MRAIAVPEFGSQPELMELPKPVPEHGDILVNLRAAGLNPVDWKIVDRMPKDDVPYRLPLILGTDGAGIVSDIGEGVTRFRPGDHVYGEFRRLPQGLGSYAEYGVAAEDSVAAMPPDMTFAQAAAVPTASTTAFRMVEVARVTTGQTVLVVGATGGVGQSAVQLAADRGAHVIATARADAAAMIERLGARETVDHHGGPLVEQVFTRHPDGIDAIIDVASGRPALDTLSTLVRPGGAIASSLGAVDPDALAARSVRGVNVWVQTTEPLLAQLAKLIDTGRLKVEIESELPLEEAPYALARNRAGGARGKTVFKI